MASVESPDKVLVLRPRPGGNRIELNFLPFESRPVVQLRSTPVRPFEPVL